MSRIGKKPIPVPTGVEIKVVGPTVTAKGPLGVLSRDMLGVTLAVEKTEIVVHPDPTHVKAASLHGLMRTLVANMVDGVSKGFSKTLVITGTGYKVELVATGLTLYLGYSKPVNFPLAADVTATVEDKGTKILLKSINKESLGDTAAKIRALREIEPYKGKGVAYLGEKIKRKAGKAGAK